MAESNWHHPLYLATAEALDDEMTERVDAHRKSRGEHWLCIEEPLEIDQVIASPPPGAEVILVDCVTIWLSNILHKERFDTFDMRRQALLKSLREASLPVILVSNEVGMGIVPENELSRKFRDLAGWLNQDLAAAAETVLFVVAGLPMALKGSLPAIPQREWSPTT